MNFLGHVIAWIIVTVCALFVGFIVLVCSPSVVEFVFRVELEPTQQSWIQWLLAGFAFLCVMGLAKDMSDRLAAMAWIKNNPETVAKERTLIELADIIRELDEDQFARLIEYVEAPAK